VSDLAGRRIREARKRRKWTVRDLADHCAKAGAGHITATVITNLETRRRATREITVDELLAIAYVLEVPPVLLMSPVSQGEELEIVPGVVKGPLEGAAWIADEAAFLEPVPAAWDRRPERTERALRWRTDTLTVLRQVWAITAWIRRAHRRGDLQQPDARVLGVRLLHLLDSLAALGYQPPEIPDVMEILAAHGIPATLREWQDETDEEPGDGPM
jgi:transcriptional regulator with XRE-family HTH domain